jgi:hypothetical protein
MRSLSVVLLLLTLVSSAIAGGGRRPRISIGPIASARLFS